jgi:hypothetical protein
VPAAGGHALGPVCFVQQSYYMAVVRQRPRSNSRETDPLHSMEGSQ